MGEAERHLSKVCKRFAKVVPGREPFPTKFEKTKDLYRALVRSVVYQQLSGKAAGTIHGRVLALFPDKDHPDPEDLLEAPESLLRGAGLSGQKIAALKDVSQKRIEGIIPPARALSRLPDEEIIERLTAARGVGRWTVEMYLIFTLGRPDIQPIDDLGVRSRCLLPPDSNGKMNNRCLQGGSLRDDNHGIVRSHGPQLLSDNPYP